ncbi:MAG TPA: gamma carbonic anhydrase family protein [Acidimicrobiia bacterium]
MHIERGGCRPQVDDSAWVASTATLIGEVSVGPESRVLHGAVITADGGPVSIGNRCVVMENAVLRGTPGRPLSVGDGVLVGPRAYLSGCTVEDEVFLATGSTVFNGAVIGRRAEIRVNGTVHLKTVLPENALVPINWVAVGDPAKVLPPQRHEEIWAIQEPLDFPGEVFGVERSEDMMVEIMDRYTRGLARWRDDVIVEEEDQPL